MNPLGMRVFSLLLVCLFSVCCVFGALAEDDGKKERELPKSGLLAGTGGGAHAGVAMGGWADVDLDGEEQPPITGSVSKITAEDWQLKMFNNSQDKYSVTVAVNQYEKRGKKIKTNSYSFSLKAGEKRDRTLRVHPMTASCKLELKRWKRYPKKKTQAELKEELEAKRQEVEELEGRVDTSK